MGEAIPTCETATALDASVCSPLPSGQGGWGGGLPKQPPIPQPPPNPPTREPPGVSYPQCSPQTRTLRPWLVPLLPFAALGLLPWWACTALALALALGRVSEDARSIAVLLALLAAVLVSLPLLPDLLRSGTLFVQSAAVGLLSLQALRWLEAGQRRGLLLPAAALLIAPTSLGLAALLLAALGMNGAESRPARQLGGRRELWPLLALALGVGAALLLLPSLPTSSTAPSVRHPATVGVPRLPRPHASLPAAAPQDEVGREPQAAPWLRRTATISGWRRRCGR